MRSRLVEALQPVREFAAGIVSVTGIRAIVSLAFGRFQVGMLEWPVLAGVAWAAAAALPLATWKPDAFDASPITGWIVGGGFAAAMVGLTIEINHPGTHAMLLAVAAWTSIVLTIGVLRAPR